MTINFDATPVQFALLFVFTVANVGSILILLRMMWRDLSSSLTIKKDSQTILWELEDRIESLDAALARIDERTDTKRSRE